MEEEFEEHSAVLLLYDGDTTTSLVPLYCQRDGEPHEVFHLFADFVAYMFEHSIKQHDVRKLAASLIAYSLAGEDRPPVVPYGAWGANHCPYTYLVELDERGVSLRAYDGHLLPWQPSEPDNIRKAHSREQGSVPPLDWAHFDWRPRGISDGNTHTTDY